MSLKTTVIYARAARSGSNHTGDLIRVG